MTNTAARSTDPAVISRLARGALKGKWTLDHRRSTVMFRTRIIWGLIPVKGTFTDIGGEGTVTAAGEVQGTINIATASIDTNSTRRDAHLRSPDFFNSDTHPNIVFTARALTADYNAPELTGTLQVRGCTQPLSVPITVTAPNHEQLDLDAAIIIDRRDFGLNWNRAGLASTKTAVRVHAEFRLASSNVGEAP